MATMILIFRGKLSVNSHLSLFNFVFVSSSPAIAFFLLEQIMHFPPESQQKRLSKAQFLHLAKEAEVEANKRRWSAISQRFLHPDK